MNKLFYIFAYVLLSIMMIVTTIALEIPLKVFIVGYIVIGVIFIFLSAGFAFNLGDRLE